MEVELERKSKACPFPSSLIEAVHQMCGRSNPPGRFAIFIGMYAEMASVS